MTNAEKVLDYLDKNGSITSYEAFAELFVTRLSAVVFNLKKIGYDIQATKEKHTNKYGETKYFNRYYIRGRLNGRR